MLLYQMKTSLELLGGPINKLHPGKVDKCPSGIILVTTGTIPTQFDVVLTKI